MKAFQNWYTAAKNDVGSKLGKSLGQNAEIRIFSSEDGAVSLVIDPKVKALVSSVKQEIFNQNGAYLLGTFLNFGVTKGGGIPGTPGSGHTHIPLYGADPVL